MVELTLHTRPYHYLIGLHWCNAGASPYLAVGQLAQRIGTVNAGSAATLKPSLIGDRGIARWASR